MLARAAQEPALWPHVVALVWQALWVAMAIRIGARLFRRRVMKSGPQMGKRRGLFRRGGRAALEESSRIPI
jgi:ABC-2 type transport system permease protein